MADLALLLHALTGPVALQQSRQAPSSGTMPLHRTVLPSIKLPCRCIQRADQPIILTGYAALNKLLGREVYTSHMQLGGPKVSS